MNAMLNKSLSPFFIGFDRFLEAQETFTNSNYPPYNLSKIGENSYILELAVAGFSRDHLKISLAKDKRVLTIFGSTPDDAFDYEFIHKGIGSRSFTKKFTLAENITVSSVSLNNGILCIKLNSLEPTDSTEQEFEIS